MGMGKGCLYFPLPTMLITQQTGRQVSDPLFLSPGICYLVRSAGWYPVTVHTCEGAHQWRIQKCARDVPPFSIQIQNFAK